MQITVKLFATLKTYGPDEQNITVSDEATVADVITMLAIPHNMPALRIVNGVHVGRDHRLREGDVLALFPPIAGGGPRPQSIMPPLLPQQPGGPPFHGT